MAAENSKLSVDQVVEKVILPGKRKRKATEVGNVRAEIKKCLLPLLQDSKAEFLEQGIRMLEPVVGLSRASLERNDLLGPTKILTCSPLNSAAIFREESRLWLAAIRRRLCSKRSAQNPFYTEITRDVPYDIFVVFRRVVQSMPGFCAPLCYLGTNKKGEVVSLTNIRLVAELFAFLSGYSEEEVAATYFKRNLRGIKSGHKVNVIASESKDFAFFYKKRQGKFFIGFNFGEWNAHGYPQHT